MRNKLFKISLMYLKGFRFIGTVYKLFDNPSYIICLVIHVTGPGFTQRTALFNRILQTAGGIDDIFLSETPSLRFRQTKN